VGARFSAHVQTGPEAHPASYVMGTGYFPGVKQPRRDDCLPNLKPRLKKEKSFTSTPLRAFVDFSRVNFILYTIKIYKYRQNTTKFIILYRFWTTCFDSLESSSGPLVN